MEAVYQISSVPQMTKWDIQNSKSWLPEVETEISR
jgi:hypothetical protein